MQNLSYENDCDLHENKPVGETHFHVNGFARGLVLTPRQTVPRKLPILLTLIDVLHEWKLSGIPSFSNLPKTRNQNSVSFPQVNTVPFPLISRTARFFKPIFVFCGGSKNRDFTEYKNRSDRKTSFHFFVCVFLLIHMRECPLR